MFETIDEYIAQFPEELQKRLIEMYNIIKEVVPVETTEKISWKMPTFYLNGNLVHFACFKNHTGLYPGEEGIENFKDQFNGLEFSKGAVRFNHDKLLPKELIQKIVKFRVKQNMKGQ